MSFYLVSTLTRVYILVGNAYTADL